MCHNAAVKAWKLLAVITGAWLSWRAACAWSDAVVRAVPPPEAVLGLFGEDGFVASVGWSFLALLALALGVLPLKRRHLLGLVVAHGSALLAVGAAELLAVVGVIDYQSWALREQARMVEEVRPWQAPDQDLRGETQPDLARLMRQDHPPIPFALRTDQFGLRNPPGSSDPPVVCLGDSILFAGLVPEPLTVTGRLAAALGEPVLNVSALGYAPQESLARLDGLGLELAGRVVLHFWYEGNDLTGSKHWRRTHRTEPGRPWRGAALPTAPRAWPETGLRAALLRWLKQPLRGMAQRRAAMWHNTTVYFLYDAGWIRRDLDEAAPLGELMARARQHFAEQGATYAVVLVPTKLSALHPLLSFPPGTDLRPDLRESRFADEILAQCEAQGVPCLDTAPVLRAKARDVLPYHLLDTHLNADGHAALAEAVSPFLQEIRAASGSDAPAGGRAPR